jgi:uncharacterized LabA/DUF88 family protein
MKTSECKNKSNIAYIDGQNLYLGTTNTDSPWEVDLARFHILLKRKYNVESAYYYIGFKKPEFDSLYKEIEDAGFIVVFKSHINEMMSKKKGNIDTDLVFDVMEKMYKDKDSFNSIVLVSGDGDYIKMVDFLIEEGKFKKVLFPNQQKASSLYKSITRRYFADLNKQSIRNKIGKRKGGLR